MTGDTEMFGNAKGDERITDVRVHARIVWDYFGQKNHARVLNSATGRVTSLLYDRIPFESKLGAPGDEGDHGAWFGSIMVGGSGGSGAEWISDVFGKMLMAAPTKNAIEAKLELVDAWARLSLPDKYLAVYDSVFDVWEPRDPGALFVGTRGRGVIGHPNEDPAWR